MRTKFHSFFTDFPHLAKAEDLKPATVGEDRAVPRNEFMQTAELEDRRVTRPQEKVICVAENDARIKRFEHFLCEGLDSALCANRHEDRRFNLAVRSLDSSCASL